MDNCDIFWCFCIIFMSNVWIWSIYFY